MSGLGGHAQEWDNTDHEMWKYMEAMYINIK